MVGPFPDEIIGTLLALPGKNEYSLFNSKGMARDRYLEFAKANPISMRTIRQLAKNLDVIVFNTNNRR